MKEPRNDGELGKKSHCDQRDDESLHHPPYDLRRQSPVLTPGEVSPHAPEVMPFIPRNEDGEHGREGGRRGRSRGRRMRSENARRTGQTEGLKAVVAFSSVCRGVLREGGKEGKTGWEEVGEYDGRCLLTLLGLLLILRLSLLLLFSVIQRVE